jgi:UDP-N-acetyl-D-glucosamine dehydrogenase
MIDVCVIGQGYVGLPISIQAANAGYNVLGLDIDSNKIENLKLGITTSPEVSKDELLSLQKSGKLDFVTELTAQHSVQIFIIAVPTPLDKKQDPDLSMLTNACETIAKFALPNTLVINESTSFIGTLRNFIKPLIEKNSRTRNLKYAVAPERIDPGNEKWNINNTPRVISGLSENAISEAVQFYSSFCGVIHRVDKPEIAEAAKLMENTFRQVNIALVNELTEIASKFNFSLHEAISAAATKPFGFMPFYPGIGVGGHCIPVDPTYLSYSARQVGVKPNFIDLANATNISMPEKIVSRIEAYLKTDLKGKQIQLAGIAYKTGVSDIRESPALELIHLLKSKGVSVTYHDPYVDHWDNLSSVELNPKIDLGVIITPHEQIDFSVWKLNKTLVIDLSSTPKFFGWPKFL